MILVKNYDVLGLESNLIKIMNMLDHQFGPGVVTSAYRQGDEGVHGTWPCRGCDRRVRMSDVGFAMARYVNNLWLYDPDVPPLQCAVFHDTGRGPHLHLQVHPNTIIREHLQDKQSIK